MKCVLLLVMFMNFTFFSEAQKKTPTTKPTVKPTLKVAATKKDNKATTILPKSKTSTAKLAINKPAEIISYNYKATFADSVYIKTAANELCNCTIPLLDSIHPLIINLLSQAISDGEKKAEQIFKKEIQKLGIEEQKILITNVNNLQVMIKKNGTFNNCIINTEKKYKDVNFNGNAAKEDVYDSLFIYYINQQCKLAALLLEFGGKNK